MQRLNRSAILGLVVQEADEEDFGGDEYDDEVVLFPVNQRMSNHVWSSFLLWRALLNSVILHFIKPIVSSDSSCYEANKVSSFSISYKKSAEEKYVPMPHMIPKEAQNTMLHNETHDRSCTASLLV